MFGFTIYRLSTGEIVRNGWCTSYRDVISQPISAEELCCDGFFDATEWYVANHQALQRPKVFQGGSSVSIAADGLDTLVIDQVPIGTRVSFSGAWHTVSDGSIVITSRVAGPYDLVLEPPFPFQRQQIRIDAHAL
jgi:hypothetical protein